MPFAKKKKKRERESSLFAHGVHQGFQSRASETQYVQESHGVFVKMQVVILWVWGGALRFCSSDKIPRDAKAASL